jgi:cytochrome b subunit of formate dehydrogenase
MSLLLIITGAIIWICMEFDKKDVAFALLVHEYVSYIALASVIWHMYKKTHILLWPKKKENQVVKAKE